MAYHVELSKRAELDLQRIFHFINAFESQAAERWFDGLEDRIQSLSKLPNRGTVTDYDPICIFCSTATSPTSTESSTASTRHPRVWSFGIFAMVRESLLDRFDSHTLANRLEFTGCSTVALQHPVPQPQLLFLRFRLNAALHIQNHRLARAVEILRP